MTTLITGAGLVGASFAKCALQRGEKVIFLDPEPRTDYLRFKLGDKGYELLRKDVRDLPALVEAMNANQVDVVVHTAGLIGGRVQQSLSNAFDINLGGTRNIAEAIRLTGVRRLVHISTFGVYDWRRPLSATIDEDFPRGGNRGYGNYKAAKELILEAYARAFGFELIMLRPANVFGVGHFWSGSSGGQKMQALVQAGLEGAVVRISAEDAIDNEYVYAPDLGRAVDLAATSPVPEHCAFNVGNGCVTTFQELVDAACSVFPGLRVEKLPGATSGSRGAPLNISRIHRELGWRPTHDLCGGLKAYGEELRIARSMGAIS